MNLRLDYSPGKFAKKQKSRTKILIWVSALLLVGISPIIADQLTNSSTENSTEATQNLEPEEAVPEVDPSDLLSSSPVPAATPNEEIEKSETQLPDSPTAEPSKIPPFAVSNQEMFMQLPSVQRVDPRAVQLNLPRVTFFAKGSPYLMICMNSSRGIIDIGFKGIDDSVDRREIFVSGDLGPSLQMSGTSSELMEIFNSYGGLRLRSPAGQSVNGTNVITAFVAVSEPTRDFTLCEQAALASRWYLEIKPLGIQINTKKNPLTLGEKRK